MNIQMPLDESQRAMVRPMSKAVFNGRYVLEALVSMAQKERFYQSQIAASAGCEPSYLGELLKRLQNAGLIERVSTEPGQARIYYQKRPSPLWGFCLDFVTSLLTDARPADITVLRST